FDRCARGATDSVEDAAGARPWRWALRGADRSASEVPDVSYALFVKSNRQWLARRRRIVGAIGVARGFNTPT
ncbi:MAG: hypothetical protein ACI855_005215, partial [Myxococcota bacterium]